MNAIMCIIHWCMVYKCNIQTCRYGGGEWCQNFLSTKPKKMNNNNNSNQKNNGILFFMMCYEKKTIHDWLEKHNV
jgi:hypothetical protein